MLTAHSLRSPSSPLHSICHFSQPKKKTFELLGILNLLADFDKKKTGKEKNKHKQVNKRTELGLNSVIEFCPTVRKGKEWGRDLGVMSFWWGGNAPCKMRDLGRRVQCSKFGVRRARGLAILGNGCFRYDIVF